MHRSYTGCRASPRRSDSLRGLPKFERNCIAGQKSMEERLPHLLVRILIVVSYGEFVRVASHDCNLRFGKLYSLGVVGQCYTSRLFAQPGVEDRSVLSFNSAKRNPHSLGG